MSTTINQGLSPTAFPHQKRTKNQKTEKFFKECIDAGIGISGWEGKSSTVKSVRSSRKNKIINYNLLNNIVDRNEMKRATDPFGFSADADLANYKNFPLVNSNIALLVGEERKRQFRPQFVVTSPDAVNEKLNRITEEFDGLVTDMVLKGVTDEQAIAQKIDEFESWKTHDYRDVRERMANQVIQYLYHTQDLKEEFSRGFEDLLAAAESIYVIEIYNREPRLRRGNPLNFYTLRGGESYKIEDNEIIVEDGYLPPGLTVDRYREYLTDSQIAKIEGGVAYHKGAKSVLGFDKQLENQPISFDDFVNQVGIGNILEANAKGTSYFGGSFDQEGNVRVCRVVWKGFRKVQIVSYYDEYGDYQEDIYPEDYKLDENRGETAETVWLTEWYEGTRIADDIYVKMQPVELQVRNPDNLAAVNPGIVGTSFNVNSFEAKSMVDMTKDYQYLYNKIMLKTEASIAKYVGKIGRLNMTLKPDGWTVPKWLYYIYNMGISIENPFNEGTKGVSKGKLAGNLSGAGSQMEIGDAEMIHRNLEILAFIENRVDQITGITPQRKGAIDNRETVGGVERAVMQSSHITEKWFGIHDATRLRALEVLLEAAKIAWDEKSFVRPYVLDDQTEAILRFDSHLFNESAYGGYLTSDSENDNILEQIRALAQPMMQNGATLDMVAELYRTKNIGDLHRKIRRYERTLREQQEQMQREAIEAEQQAAAAEQEFRMLELELEIEQKELDRELEYYKADLNAQIKLEQQSTKEGESSDDSSKEAIEREKLNLEERIKNREIQMKERVEKRKAQLEEKKIAAEKELQKLKDEAAKKRELIKARAKTARSKANTS